MKQFLLIFILFIYEINAEELINYNIISFPFEFEKLSENNLLGELQVIEKSILINDSINPGDSINNNLSEYIQQGEFISSISTIYYKNSSAFFRNQNELGVGKIVGNKIDYYLNTNFPLDTLFILVKLKDDKNSMKLIELVIPVFFEKLTECKFDGNLICNGGFEKFYYTNSLDIFKPFQSCVNAGIQSWFGTSSDTWGRNIYYKNRPEVNPYSPSGQINHYRMYNLYNFQNNTVVKHIDYNPDTYDKDINNRVYMGAKAVLQNTNGNLGARDNLKGESFYQNLLQPLSIDKKYILEYQVLMNTDYSSDTKSPNIDDIQIFSTSYLADYDPCTFSNHEEMLFRPDDKMMIDKSLLEFDKWIHVKSKVFTPVKPMTWFWLGYTNGSGLKDIFYEYSLFFDDVIIREAGVGITSSVDNYFPCLGDIIEYKFKIWKDDPEDFSDVEVHNLLPDGLEYISGSFVKDSDGILKTIIKGDEFDEKGIAWLNMQILVPNDEALNGKEFTNEIYFPDMPEEYRPSVGKYKITIHAGRNLIDIKQDVVTTKCKGDTAEVRVNITNSGNEKIDDLLVTLYDITGLDVIWKQVQIFDSTQNNWINIVRPELYLNDKIVNVYGSFSGQYTFNEKNDMVLNSIVLEPSKSVNIRYYGILNQNSDNIIVKTTARPQHQACLMIQTETIPLYSYSFNNGIFPDDTIACSEIILQSPYPEMLNKWNDGSTNNYLTITETGKYSLEVIDKNGCKIKDSVYVYLNNEFNLSIINITHTVYKGDTITVPVVFYFKDAYDNQKFIDIELEIDENMINLLEGVYTVTKIGIKDKKTIYRISTERTIPKNYVNKNIKIDLRFIIKNTDPDDYEIIINNVVMNGCNYLKEAKEINFTLGNPDLIRISGSEGSTEYLEIYPTPFGNEITLKFNLSKLSDVTIQLNDLLGRNEKEITFKNLTKGLFEYTFNTHSLSSGFYNICLIVNGNPLCKKSVKIE